MTDKAPRSLFGELLDWMAAPMLIIWTASVLLIWGVAQDLAHKPYDRELAASAEGLAEQLRRLKGHPGPLALSAESLSLLTIEEDDTVLFQVLGARGELLAGDARLPAPAHSEAGPGPVRLGDVQIQGDTYRLASVWVRAPEQAGWQLVQVAESLGKRQRLASDIIKGVVLPQFSLLPLAALLAWLALRQGLKPLHALSQHIRERQADDLSPINEHEAPEEILPMVQATNELLARREHAMKLQHQFLADAAHQLKTPLAGLRMQAELAGRALQSGQASTKELARSFEQIALGSQRAAHMVSQLLSLARSDAAGNTPREAIELASLAREVTQDFVPQAMDKRIDLGFEGPDNCQQRVLGERWLLVELLRNLVDNALRYTPPGGEVTVRITEDPFGHVVVAQVEDSGPGIARSAREQVFQPFFRQLGTGVEGSGLGLTIAGQIAERHGTRIELDDTKERRDPGTLPGARFTVRFAAQAAATADSKPTER